MTSDCNRRTLYQIVCATVIVSLLLSLSQILLDNVINKDGILYLQSAYHIAANDWSSAARHYNWLFYPSLIAYTSTWLGLELELSAHLLNALFAAITCAAFVSCVHAMGGRTKAVLWGAALVILCFPKLNEYRNLIVRDHGYWAFYLLGCYAFFRLCTKFSWQHGVLLISAFSLASLFRIEGLIFLIGTLLFLALNYAGTLKTKTPRKPIGKATLCFLLVAMASVFVISTNTDIGKLKEYDHNFDRLLLIDQNYQTRIGHTGDYLNTLTHPATHSENHASAILFSTFLIIFFLELLNSLSLGYAIGLAWTIKRKLYDKQQLNSWAWLIFLNVLLLMAFLSINFFLTGRYPLALALTLLLLLPLLVQWLWKTYQDLNNPNRKWFYIGFIIFSIHTLDGLVSMGTDKTYLKQAGKWIKENTKNTSQIYSNNPQVIFYSNLGWNWLPRQIKPEETLDLVRSKTQLKHYDLIALQVRRKTINRELEYTTTIGKKPIETFSNQKGDKVLIYAP